MWCTVSTDGLALVAAGEVLKTDKQVVAAAVKQDGSALAYAGEQIVSG